MKTSTTPVRAVLIEVISMTTPNWTSEIIYTLSWNGVALISCIFNLFFVIYNFFLKKSKKLLPDTSEASRKPSIHPSPAPTSRPASRQNSHHSKPKPFTVHCQIPAPTPTLAPLASVSTLSAVSAPRDYSNATFQFSHMQMSPIIPAFTPNISKTETRAGTAPTHATAANILNVTRSSLLSTTSNQSLTMNQNVFKLRNDPSHRQQLSVNNHHPIMNSTSLQSLSPMTSDQGTISYPTEIEEVRIHVRISNAMDTSNINIKNDDNLPTTSIPDEHQTIRDECNVIDMKYLQNETEMVSLERIATITWS